MSEPPSSWRRQTIAVAAGRERSPGAPLNVPPTFAATYRDGGEIGYGRFDNPTWAAFERTIGALEGGHAVSFASGQAASTAVLTPLAQGATVVLPQDAYTGTRALMSELEQRGALSLRAVDVTDTEAVLAALDGARLLWLESPTNPMLGIAELPRLLEAARSARVFSVVDNTFATPVLQQPLALGADAVLHSATKYLGGHSDLVMGVVVTAHPQRREVLVEHRTMRGSVPGVMEAYLALRGLRTLAVRVREQSAAALELATRLNGDPRIHAVHYPGLASDPGHERASAQMSAFGGMVSFELRDGDAADRLVGALRLIVGGTSLGGVESTIDRRRRWPGEERVPAGLLRLSVGLEHVEDLWEDLDQALTGSAFAP
ncbi:MAG: trans-sulfuration enzyme family protein [Solirubrobacterales bacterium]